MHSNNFLTIGVLVHIDAGKTTLTERFLYNVGATKTVGSVDKGSATTDNLAIEKSRGISVKNAAVSFNWKDKIVQLVDTPGHVDFSSEVDFALSILDLVVLVVSAKDGIQAHTISLWESIQERGLPVIIFVNKIDQIGVDTEAVFLELEKEFRINAFALNFVANRSDGEVDLLDFIQGQAYLNSRIIENSLENLAEINDVFLKDYLDGKTNDLSGILKMARAGIKENKLVGLVFGSAKRNEGIELLLDIICSLFEANRNASLEPSAKVFKVAYETKLGRLAYVRSFGGPISIKDELWSQQRKSNIKLNQIFKLEVGKKMQVKKLSPGEIGLITASEILMVGDVLGHIPFEDDFEAISAPVLTVEVKSKLDENYQKLGEALEILNIENPCLELVWLKSEREFHIKILGPIQTEVLKESLLTRFDIEADFLPAKVIYKETPHTKAEGVVRYTMPKPCWSVMKFRIEPGDPGSGVVFESKVRTSDISLKYQNEVKRAIPWSLRQGLKGWEVTDIKITLLEGEDHVMHSNPGNFLLATPMGVMRGLEAADTDLLEPIYAFEIKADQDLLGPISSDLNQMLAQIDAPEFDEGEFRIKGKLSVEKAQNYSIRFNALTSGKGRIKLKLFGYQKTETTQEKTRPFIGVSPLNESQWILHNRGAFKAEERKRGWP